MTAEIPATSLPGAPEALRKNLDWYIAHQQELASEHNGKILLIVDQKLVNVFDDFTAAYVEATKNFAPDTFTLQPCSAEPDSYTLMLYSPAFSGMHG